MANLVQTVMDALTPDVTSRAASLLGESPAAVNKGFGAAVPALLAGAAQRSGAPGGADSLLDLVRRTLSGGAALEQKDLLAGDPDQRAARVNEGKGIASSLLGGNTGAVTNALGSFSGLGAGAASGLLALAAPMVLGVLGRAAGPNPTPDGLRSLLNNQRSGIFGALPAGMGSLFGAGASASPLVGGVAKPAASGIGRFLPWILLAAAAAALLFGLRTCNAKREVTTGPTITAPTTSAPTLPEVKIPSVSLNLPGGGKLDVPQGSIGFAVSRFLESNEPAPKTFIFDNLNFATASNTLTPESRPTITALTTILKAYPAVNGRVVGYTDNQGDPAANKNLSDARAAEVKAQLVAGGIPADRIETAGMGELNPVANNTTEEGRAKNRRTELVIVKK